jgi:hypothetical protein
MTLVYRAVWDDEWSEPLLVLQDEFEEWCSSKGIDKDDIPRRGDYQVSDRLAIEVRRADAEIGRALRCTLTEVDDKGRRWRTTATALADDDARAFWVDLDFDDPYGGRAEMAAPRLVRGLIENGGRPICHGQLLRTQADRVVRLDDIPDLVALLADPEREMPLVVFSPDLRAEPRATVDRADAAAETLAGLALVYVLSPRCCTALTEQLPTGFSVFGGAVRLYLPEPKFDDPDDSYRHRWIPLRIISAHPRRAATMLASRLVRLQLHPPVPAAWGRLGGLLRRPTETEVAERATEITSSRPTVEGTSEVRLRSEVDDLTRLLAEADLLREATERDAEREIARLNAALASSEADSYSHADELEELRAELDALRRTWRTAFSPRVPNENEQQVDFHELDVPSSIGDAIELARVHLRYVQIPEEALHDIEELEATAKYAVWASTIWQGLLALNDYAEAKARGEQPPGFKIWCDRTCAWPGRKLAMTESDTVLKNDLLRNQRRFVISTEVHPDGRIHMFSHLKIQPGGGDHIPRLYFHDDTDGTTRSMHVGFLGPHRHIRNTRS